MTSKVILKSVLKDYVDTLDSVKQGLQDTLDSRNAAKSALDQAKAETLSRQNALKEAEKRLQNAVDAADDKTYGTVPGLDEAVTAEEALKALEQEKQIQDQKLTDLTQKLEQALQEAADKQAEASAKEQNATATGITADGDVNLEANSSSGSVSIGQKDNALGVTAGGTTHIGTGEGTLLKDVHIDSNGDLTIDSIVAEDTVTITATGDIKGSEGQDTVDIIAPSGSLSSLRGDIGAKENPLKTSLDSVSAFGENIYLDNIKDLVVDSIIAGGNVDLTVDGDVSGSAESDGADMIGGDIQIDASGDIGTEDAPLKVESDEFGTTGGDIHISSEGDVKVDKIVGENVSISSGGKVTDKGNKDSIIADNLVIDAGAVGEVNNPLNVNVSGKLNIHAEYGYINLVNSYRIPDSGDIGRTGWRYRTLIHIPTGIRVSGYISSNAGLLVTEGCEHENCIVCKYLEKLPMSIVLSRYHIALTGGYYGLLYVQIPVDQAFEGKIVTIAYCDDGRLVTIQVAVRDGYASFFVDRLHTFVILDGQYHAATEGGHQMLASDDTGETVYVDGLVNTVA